jgi:hypothetical protein
MALRYLDRGTFDGVVWVTDPSNFDHRMLRAVRESARIELMAVDEAAFTAMLPDGTHVYDVGQVRVDRNAAPIATVCTSALLLAGGEVPTSLVERARRMRGLRPMGNGVTGQEPGGTTSP